MMTTTTTTTTTTVKVVELGPITPNPHHEGCWDFGPGLGRRLNAGMTSFYDRAKLSVKKTGPIDWLRISNHGDHYLVVPVIIGRDHDEMLRQAELTANLRMHRSSGGRPLGVNLIDARFRVKSASSNEVTVFVWEEEEDDDGILQTIPLEDHPAKDFLHHVANRAMDELAYQLLSDNP